MAIKTYYKQKFPHIQNPGQIFFVTFRLYGSFSFKELEYLTSKFENRLLELKENYTGIEYLDAVRRIQFEYFLAYDQLLDKCISGPNYLKTDEIADIVKQQIHRFDNDLYELICYCVMSNHVHLLISTEIQLKEESKTSLDENYVNLDQILKKIKGASAFYCNRHLGLSGRFWTKESFDRYIRDEQMLNNVVAYILNNPVDAGITENWEQHPHTYYKYKE